MRRKRQPGTAAALAVIDEDPSRGPTFWWLFHHHDEILKRKEVAGRIPWNALLAKVHELGLTNAQSDPVRDAKALKLTFERVTAHKTRIVEAKQNAPRSQSRPTDVPPPLVPVSHPPMALLGRGAPANKPGEPIDQLERLRRKTLLMSGKRV